MGTVKRAAPVLWEAAYRLLHSIETGLGRQRRAICPSHLPLLAMKLLAGLLSYVMRATDQPGALGKQDRDVEAEQIT